MTSPPHLAFEAMRRVVASTPRACSSPDSVRQQLIRAGVLHAAPPPNATPPPSRHAGITLELDDLAAREAAAIVAKEQERISAGRPPRFNSRRAGPDAEGKKQ